MRVGVTTTEDGYSRVASKLRQRGLEPVKLPCIRIAPAPESVLEEIREASSLADWLVLTSARTVRILWPSGGIPDVPTACVGDATAMAVKEAGGEADVVGASGASALMEELAPRVEGATVVFPHARAADPGHSQRLRSAGATVIAMPAYDTLEISPGEASVDAVIFGSPSAVRGWLQTRNLEGVFVAAMGPTTASALNSLGRPADIVPDQPGFEAVVERLSELALRG